MTVNGESDPITNAEELIHELSFLDPPIHGTDGPEALESEQDGDGVGAKPFLDEGYRPDAPVLSEETPYDDKEPIEPHDQEDDGGEGRGVTGEHDEPKRTAIFRCLDSIGCGCIARFPERWPRIFYFCFGVVLPLWIIIMLAVIFGYGLARLEAPGEIDSNDEKLQTKYRIEAADNLTASVVAAVPKICLNRYLQNMTGPIDFPRAGHPDIDSLISALAGYLEGAEGAFEEFVEAPVHINAETSANATAQAMVDVNMTDMFRYLNECGQFFGQQIGAINEITRALVLVYDGLTFNWNRCVNETWASEEGFLIDLPWLPGRVYDSLHPQAQQAYYEEIWLQDFHELNQTIFEQLLPSNASYAEQVETYFKALIQATEQATGALACITNQQSGAWFFFTVATTIGYGNQAPETVEGQSMLYTVGFLSILVFAAVASGSGHVVSAIFEDFMKKTKLHILTHPMVSIVFWGGIYYLWLLLIAGYTADWKQNRLGEEFSYSDGYWFAYISTTTVGLGDIYLEPAVIVTQDLLTFSLLFLIGFVFLASFLGRLGRLVSTLENVGGMTFEQNLEKTNICCGYKAVEYGYDAGKKAVKASKHVVKAGKNVLTRSFGHDSHHAANPSGQNGSATNQRQVPIKQRF